MCVWKKQRDREYNIMQQAEPNMNLDKRKNSKPKQRRHGLEVDERSRGVQFGNRSERSTRTLNVRCD